VSEVWKKNKVTLCTLYSAYELLVSIYMTFFSLEYGFLFFAVSHSATLLSLLTSFYITLLCVSPTYICFLSLLHSLFLSTWLSSFVATPSCHPLLPPPFTTTFYHHPYGRPPLPLSIAPPHISYASLRFPIFHISFALLEFFVAAIQARHFSNLSFADTYACYLNNSSLLLCIQICAR
jgi:hypothetical protein